MIGYLISVYIGEVALIYGISRYKGRKRWYAMLISLFWPLCLSGIILVVIALIIDWWFNKERNRQ